ncbi:MAG: STAS domain-containing protein [Spirochaetia bacterium]
MDITIRKFEANYVIDVGGEVDLSNAHRLNDVVHTMMQKQVRVFILNLKKVTYVDSSGIGAVLAIHALLSREGRAFRIVNVSRPVQRVLELTKLVGFLPIMASELEAIESIAADAPADSLDS